MQFIKDLADRVLACYTPKSFGGIAQLVEHWSPKPRVMGSSPIAPAKKGPRVINYTRSFLFEFP